MASILLVVLFIQKLSLKLSFRKFRRKGELVFYISKASYPTFTVVGHYGRFLTDGFLAMCLNLNTPGTEL